MKIFRSICLTFILSLFSASTVLAQTLIRDSIVLEIEPRLPEHTLSHFQVDSVVDLRNVHNPRLLGIKGTKQLIIVPVDLEILTEVPLAELVKNAFTVSRASEGQSLTLALHNFELSSRSGFPFRNRYTIHARVTVTSRSDVQRPPSKGELVFDSNMKTGMFKDSPKKGYELAFAKWLTELRRSLIDAVGYMHDDSKEPPYNYRSAVMDHPWMQLNASGCVSLLNEGYLIDGSLYFVYPETRQTFLEHAGTIRYRHQDRFDSIEFGLANLVMNHRISRRTMVQFRSNLFFGFNRWQDMGTVKHKLQDVLIADLSLSESIHYYPQHVRTPVLGLGLLQGVRYIHSPGFRIEYGILFHIGIRL